MNLFNHAATETLKKASPLAARMRPKSLDDFVGQEKIIGAGSLLRRSIEGDQLSSLIFYGPPGSGKTTLAKIISQNTKSNFRQLSAVTAGIADLKKVIQEARENLGLYATRTILFVDEIHRFNKGQQDALLPVVEEGTIVLIGATTENPYFEVNSALLSRSRIFRLVTLSPNEIKKIILRALSDLENGLGRFQVRIDEEALTHLVNMSAGDARIALNALELAVTTTPPGGNGERHIDLKVVEQSIQKPAVRYDKRGDTHFDVVSAFIKSMRGSDPDATLHWLARMLEAGENPEFIMRRVIICAAEDVGLADPQALTVAMAASQALAYVGLPEARLPMAEAALYMACAPKSNAVLKGIDGAINDMHKGPVGEVPLHLRDAHYKGAKRLGHGKNYIYPQDCQGNYTSQQYLPDDLKGIQYYQPTKNGLEKEIGERLKKQGLR